MRVVIRTIFCVCLSLLLAGPTNAQNMDWPELGQRAEALEAERDSLYRASKATERVEDKVTLREKPGPFGDELHEIPEREEVRIVGIDDNYVQVAHNESTGWVNKDIAFGANELDIEFSPSARERMREVKEELEEVNCLLDLKGEGPAHLVQTACDGKVQIGMSPAMVRKAWGEPDDVNRTRTRNTTREQWAYGSLQDRKFVYIRDGEVTTIQN